MPNKNYLKGRRKEYKIRREYLNNDWDIVQRTAGSHSPVDIIAIDKITKRIDFIQCKPDDMTEKEKEKIISENQWLNGVFRTEFRVV